MVAFAVYDASSGLDATNALEVSLEMSNGVDVYTQGTETGEMHLCSDQELEEFYPPRVTEYT